MINESVYALYEGVGSIVNIKPSMKLGANHPMGPLELADFIGLDTCHAIMNVLQDGLADTKYRPGPLLVKYLDPAGCGRRSAGAFTTIAATRPSRAAEQGRVPKNRVKIAVPAYCPRFEVIWSPCLQPDR